MKLSILTIAASAAALSTTHAFTTNPCRTMISRPQQQSVCLDMFSGGALDVEEEEDDEKRAQIEQTAKAMGMSVEEYQLGMNARLRMEDAISNLRVIGGDVSTGVTVEKDGNMPPRHLVVTVTEEGKGMGKARLEKAIVEALKSANEKSKVGRDEAQKDMMTYISGEMKKMGGM
mmetsp:Transcript_34374/g.72363  ORF Transcript_34374/g.72363 Transcript_34374/m.72363 type:complete len:174 (-) Transcript_34374:199-720(-)|eukprot:CAMPEP_0196131372 /NCGR_PEP_ID=MMETSP0910-20130528/1410_1 /TAXON_ID=49265 /ORGANISM="Thalassiosira rotula, Strain GSO102" /LENGTH=173 /DNA_ID=CAMNT_0041390837 /DNA_START=49 /DNA_END=570 /DNA_ORIENTATION=-